jgi:hypothetical protein
MSTRALYTFRGWHDNPDDAADDTWNVYKHHDGYPSGAAEVLRNAIDHFAWPLPRYEADEFAGAFIAAAKAYKYLWFFDPRTKLKQTRRQFLRDRTQYRPFTSGDIRLMPQGNPAIVAHENCADIEYRYEIMMGRGGKKLIIKAIRGNWWNYSDGVTRTYEQVLFYGPFEDFERAAKALDLCTCGLGGDEPCPAHPAQPKLRKEFEHRHTGRVA